MASDPPRTTALAQLTSRCPTEQLRAASRRDIYWSGDWIDQANPVAWYRRGDMELERDYSVGGEVHWPDGTVVDRDHGRATLAASPMRGERLALLGAIDQWRTMTIEQAAAVAGVSVRSASEKRVLSAMSSAGLLDWGVSMTEVRSRRRTLPHLPFVRPARSTAFEKLIEPQLTYAQLLAITGGLDFAADRQFDRHNVLSTELGLRAAEFLPEISTVIGEKLARTDLLFDLPAFSHAGGDLILVREDGLRIVVEMTATVAKSFRGKVEKWASLMSRHSLASSGVVVLFVDASRPTDGKSNNLAEIRKQVSIQASAHPGVSGSSVADRMFVTSWRDLFPAPHAASDDFLSLSAWAPTGPSTGGRSGSQRWQRRSLLDADGPVRLASTPEQLERLAALKVSSRMLAGTPFWMRSAADVGVWNSMLERTGVDRIPLRSAQTSRLRSDGSWGAPENTTTEPGALYGIGGQTVPRIASRGLPVVQRSRVVRVPDSETASPAWNGFSFAAEAAAAPAGTFATFALPAPDPDADSGADLLEEW